MCAFGRLALRERCTKASEICRAVLFRTGAGNPAFGRARNASLPISTVVGSTVTVQVRPSALPGRFD